MDSHKLRADYPAEKRQHSFEAQIPMVPLTPKQQARLDAIKTVLREDDEGEDVDNE